MSQPILNDLSSFKKSFSGDVVTPSDPDYESLLHRWATNTEKKAAIIALVKSAEDVGLAIGYAKANKLPIAVRSGGHSPSGASSSEGGIVIDLSKYLNTVVIDVENKKAIIGGGTLWESVDKAAIQHGLAAVSGTVNTVRFSLSFRITGGHIDNSTGRCWRV